MIPDGAYAIHETAELKCCVGRMENGQKNRVQTRPVCTLEGLVVLVRPRHILETGGLNCRAEAKLHLDGSTARVSGRS
jgi:hypothetical protein